MTENIAELLAGLAEYAERDPERVRRVFEAMPEQAGIILSEMRKLELAALCQEFSVNGFFSHYELFTGIEPPKHIKRWTKKIFTAHENGRGFVLNGFRGCWKTTTWGVQFMTYFIAHFPLLTNVVVSANDDSAEKICKSVAAIIEYHPNWELAYPSVKPDVKRGWSVEGYYVMDTAVAYAEWVKQRATIIDPTLIGGGLESTRINGKHPSGVLYPDDVHDINNSRSQSEREGVIKRMTSVVLKTAIRKDDKLSTWVIVTGVPWPGGDTYKLLANSGEYDSEYLPAMYKANEGDKGAVYIDGANRNGIVYDDIAGWWILEWPEKFGVNSILGERALGKFEFWQMIMMDVETARASSLRYYSFPADEIDWNWPGQAGADPTNVIQPAHEGARRSSFALAVILERPRGGAVLVDGVLEPCSLAQAENHIEQTQTKFPHIKNTAIENVGGGAVVVQSMSRNRKLRIVASGLKGISDKVVRSKRDRFEQDTAKYFENGSVLVSSANSPFLNAFRNLMENFYDLDPRHSEEFDAADAVFHALRNMPKVLIDSQKETDYPQVRQRQAHPLEGIRDYVGYGVR